MNRKKAYPKLSLGESDLAAERHALLRHARGTRYREAGVGEIRFSLLQVSAEGAAALGRPAGRYLSLHFPSPPLWLPGSREALGEALLAALLYFFPTPPDRLLVAGVGNRRLTADSLGPLAAEGVEATAVLPPGVRQALSPTASAVGVCVPDVFARTGIESVATVKAAKESFFADALLVFDALAASDSERLLTTVELCDSGTVPGSGVKNSRHALSPASLRVPVVAVGVPCVMRLRGGLFVVPEALEEGVRALASVLADTTNLFFGGEPPSPSFTVEGLFKKEKP